MNSSALIIVLAVTGGLLFLILVALIVAAELLLYYTSNGKADLTFAIKKSSNNDSGDRMADLRHRDKEWLKQQNTEEFFIESAEGFKLRALFLPAPGDSKRLALCIHGVQSYGEREFAVPARYFYEHGISSLIIDQRAYGKSEGKYVTYGLKESDDAKRWLDFIVEKFGPDMKVFVCGSSMGSSTTLLLGNYDLPSNVEYLVADSGYASAKDQITYTMKTLHFPSKLCYFLYKAACKVHGIYDPDKVNVLDAALKVKVPIVFLQGDSDKVVPSENIHIFADACKDMPIKVVITEGLGHVQSLVLSKEAQEAAVNGVI